MAAENPESFQPFVPASESPRELTLAPVIMGALLGIVFGASSVYLVLKVGLTVSASIPVAVLAFALFRGLSKAFGFRKATVLENNIVQTTGSAGESIAFGVGFVMPALLLLGYDIDVIKVMTVGVFGGLLGILMMIPLRRVFIVQKHNELKYPEGTACADVLIAGEKGGSTAQLLFLGFGIGFIYTMCAKLFHFWKEETDHALDSAGLKGGAVGGEWTPQLLGVGYIIGPRIAGIMVAGGVLAYLVMTPTIKYFGENVKEPLAPAVSQIDNKTGKDMGLIANMGPGEIRYNYILYIGAGAVAAGGIISMLKALPVIFGSVVSAYRDLRKQSGGSASGASVQRTERDMPMSVVLFGSIGLVAGLFIAPSLGLGLNAAGIVGAVMILVFGFLFVTVSSRLTGEIGSSSNPISGMTVATLLLTCVTLLALSEFGIVKLGKETNLLALIIAGVVCVACSNGGTTAQALKTGHLVGATPIYQQYAILIGSLTSALVIGLVLIFMNQAGTVYSKKNLPTVKVDVSKLKTKDTVRTGPYMTDKTEYFVLNIGDGETSDTSIFLPKAGEKPVVPAGRYLVSDSGEIAYLCDPAINGKLMEQDDGTSVKDSKYNAPKTQLVALIIKGIFGRNLPWGLVIIGILIAVTLELSGVPSLPFAVGVYLPLAASVPIFVGGAIRWVADSFRGNKADDGDSSPGVLLSSGYIAGGSIMAVVYAFMKIVPDLTKKFEIVPSDSNWLNLDWPTLSIFGLLCVFLLFVGAEFRKPKSS
ncbi:MAG: oligopeptide transporter, OPT family [Gemmataceae bacterium]